MVSPLYSEAEYSRSGPEFMLNAQNPLLAAANAGRAPPTGSTTGEDDTLSDYVPDSRDLSVSRAVSRSVLMTLPTPVSGCCACLPDRRAVSLISPAIGRRGRTPHQHGPTVTRQAGRR